MSSVFSFVSSIFETARVRSNGAHVKITKKIVRSCSEWRCLPVGARIYRQQFVGIVDDLGDVGPKRQQTVLMGGRFVSTEDELGACVGKLLELSKDIFQADSRKIFELDALSERERTKEMTMLRQRLQEHIELVRGPLAQTWSD